MFLPPVTKSIFEVYEKPGQKRNRGDVSKTTTGFLCCKKVHYTDTGSHLYSKKISFVEIMHRLSSELDNPTLKLKADSYKNLYQIVDYMKGQKAAHIEYKNAKHSKFANFMTKLRAFFSQLQNQWNGFGKETSLKMAEDVLLKIQKLEQSAKEQNPPVPQATLQVEEVPFAPIQAAVDLVPPAYEQPAPAPAPVAQFPLYTPNVLNDKPPDYTVQNNDRFAAFGLSNEELTEIKNSVIALIPQEIREDPRSIEVFHLEAVEIGRKLLNKLIKLPNIKPLNEETLRNYTHEYCNYFLSSKPGKRFLVRKSSTKVDEHPFKYFAVSKCEPQEIKTIFQHTLLKFNTETKKWSGESLDSVQYDTFYDFIKATFLDHGYKSISAPQAQEVEAYIVSVYD